MVIQNYRDIKARAEKTLSYTPWDIKKTALLFGGVPMLISLLLNCIDMVLVSMANSGGIAGIELYGKLSSVSTVLWTAANIFQLLWIPAIGYCGLMLLREQNPYPKGLLQGFRKWKPLVRLIVLLVLIFFLASMAVSSAVASIMVPFMPGLWDMTATVPETEAEMMAYLESIYTEDLLKDMMPIIIVYMVVLIGLAIFFVYRARLSILLALDEENIGAWRALRESFRLTRGSCLQLFRLDLSYWWYFLLVLLCDSIIYLRQLPVFADWNENLVFLLVFLVQSIATLGVYMLGLMKINTANAVAYDHLRTQPQTDLPQLPEETHDI